MTIAELIKKKITNSINVLHLDLENESAKHSVPRGSETHFKLLLVSDDFANLSRINRQKRIYSILEAEMKGIVHALTMRLLTSDEWQSENDKSVKFNSPPCLGGSKKA